MFGLAAQIGRHIGTLERSVHDYQEMVKSTLAPRNLVANGKAVYNIFPDDVRSKPGCEVFDVYDAKHLPSFPDNPIPPLTTFTLPKGCEVK